MTTPSTKDVSGLHLIAGIGVFLAMTFILWEISESVRDHEPLTITDAQLSTWLHIHQTPGFTAAMLAITYLGSTAVVSSIAAAFALYFIARRRFYWLAALASSVFGGMLLNKLLKYAFHRPRPFFENPLLTLTSYSFPSGHTMMATVLYGVLAAFLISKVRQWAGRLLIVVVAWCLVLLVAFSRVYLGAHYLGDVLAAMAEGLAWLSLCLTVVYFVWQRN